MRKGLQMWINRRLRKILGAVGTTPVDAMLEEMGMKREEWGRKRERETGGRGGREDGGTGGSI
ncbi:hypothetical protein C7212DRAFT_320682, partial [Tuber magnatum]